MKKHVFQVIKAAAASIIISLVFVLIFTLIIQFCSLSSSVIKPVNQVFKIVSIIAGGLIFIRGDKGWLKGIIYGLAAVIITYFLYAAIARSISISWTFAIEILLGDVSSAITGIIAVHVKKPV